MARKRLARFKEVRRAWFSLWMLMGLYLISLGSELICNTNPLWIRFQGRWYFPAFFFYPEETFLEGGRKTRPDYKAMQTLSWFREDPSNVMRFAPIPYGPLESIDPGSIPVSKRVTAVLTPVPGVGSVNIDRSFAVVRSLAFHLFFTEIPEAALVGKDLSGMAPLAPEILEAVRQRFANAASPAVKGMVERKNGKRMMVSLSAFIPREMPPESVRITFREIDSPESMEKMRIVLSNPEEAQTAEADRFPILKSLPTEEERRRFLERAAARFLGPVEPLFLTIGGRPFKADFEKEAVRFPHGPVQGHWMGIDAAGRDVLARILYGLRTSLTFGLLLVAGSMALGIVTGAIQGYAGGGVDMVAQRLIEIWSALPFLYVMILLGSTYGRSFLLLLVCYGLFNWIGISYYVRGEFLRLRRQPFVEAARCMGISTLKILFRHILPNALVPVITFFPFSLVGAIGALAALDYLGFGLPPPTPSWGELLFQAQQYRWAWWLILYPSLALFTVMLLGILVGEGVRNAYDPRRYARME